MPSTSHPCLPQDLVSTLKAESLPPLTSKSRIFDPQFEEVRLKAIKLPGDRSLMDKEICRDDPPTEFSPAALLGNAGRLMNNTQRFRPGDGKKLLHSAVRDRDVLAAYEMLRMGINIDAKDTEGVTPLFFALECIYNIVISQMGQSANTAALVASVPPTIPPSFSPDEESELQIGPIEHIAVLLIEQHADVNAGAFGFTPLILAVATARWRIVKLLLRHGGLPASPYSIELASSTNKARFATLIADTKPTNPRPHRPCPCWSGKLLSKCHDAAKQPYPDHFLCCCGKRKTYGACCAKRGLVMKEKWDEESARIMTIQALKKPLPDIMPEIQQDFNAGWDISLRAFRTADPMRVQEAMISTPQARREFLFHHLNTLGRTNDVDPAFWHALSVVNFLPRLWTTLIDIQEGPRRMIEWNAAVDSYILQSLGTRWSFEVEVKAKIDSHGGPLYKHCEARGCAELEGMDVEKMKRCSGCQLIVYCGRECQSRDWKTHKKHCGPKTHHVQLLHSQWTVEQVMATLHASLADIASKNPDDPAAEAAIERVSIQMISALGHCDFLPTS